jgi:hypothetical protein
MEQALKGAAGIGNVFQLTRSGGGWTGDFNFNDGVFPLPAWCWTTSGMFMAWSKGEPSLMKARCIG